LGEKQTGQGGIALFYFHPCDLWKRSAEQRRELQAGWVNLYLGNTLRKFEKLLDTFPLASIQANLQALKDQAKPVPLGGRP
jgi:hypothetical protein